jgi:putative hemolysin/rhodanese-related sulfurtransferase
MDTKLVLLSLSIVILMAACTSPTAELPNPASKNCVDLGYELEMREGVGGTYGICKFPDGTECEEWSFFRNECEPGDLMEVECAVPDDCEGKVHIMCVGAWECVAGQCEWSCDQGEEVTGYTEVTVAQAKELIEKTPGLIIIDVSPVYEDGHIPGAVNYYVGDGSLDAAIPSLDPRATYLVYCHVDSAAILGAQKLVDAGFTNVYRLKGNYMAWVDAGYEIER